MSRIDRIEALLKREVAAILQKEYSSRQIGFITITSVDVSQDLHNARVFYSQLGSEDDKAKTLSFLRKSSRFIKGELGKVLHLKTIPNLDFVFDASIERGSEIIAKLNSL